MFLCQLMRQAVLAETDLVEHIPLCCGLIKGIIKFNLSTTYFLNQLHGVMYLIEYISCVRPQCCYYFDFQLLLMFLFGVFCTQWH